MEQYYGIEFLRYKLKQKMSRVRLRYGFYEMKNVAKDFGISTPPKLRNLKYVLGWCATSVDALADRIIFNEFRNDITDFASIADQNNPDIYYDSAVHEALIAACSFTYISEDEDGYPRWQVINADNATGIYDPITGLLSEGYAVLKRDKRDIPILEAYFLPYKTEIWEKGKLVDIYEHKAPYPLLVPHINRPDSRRPFGHSRISRACMDIVSSAIRTVKRSEIAAEFYSFPQKYLVGTSEDFEIDKWNAAMSAMMSISKDEDGDHPVVGQFQQESMTPHLDQLKMFAGLFAGETGLTLDDLGFPTDNPASAEAIKSQHENLRLKARKAQRNFGSSFINVGYLSACLRDNESYQRRAFYKTKCAWEPIFEPDSSMLSSIGDGVIKLNNAVNDFITPEKLSDLTGIR